MKFLFNPISGVFDIVETTGSSGSGNVTGIPPTTIGAIAQWADTIGETIANSPGTFVQASGAINAQEFIFNRSIEGLVTVPDGYTMLATSIIIDTGNLVLDGTAQVLLL
jgi:hypothetical protein